LISVSGSSKPISRWLPLVAAQGPGVGSVIGIPLRIGQILSPNSLGMKYHFWDISTKY
jgi:hypothetical protein